MKSIFKAITWRIIAASTTMAVVYVLTGDVASAGSAAAIAGTIKMVLYVLHDKAWDAIKTKAKGEAQIA